MQAETNKDTEMYYIFFIGIILLAILLQLFSGNFPLLFFAFPLNLVFAVLWLFLLWKLYKEGKALKITRILSSRRTSIISISLFIWGCLVIGLFPQLSHAEADAREGVAAALGCYDFMTSWPFIAILFILLSNLAMITVHAFYHRKNARKRFLLNHLGLWLALFAGFFGSSDTQTLRIPLYKDEPAREAYDMNGSSYYLDYEMELRSFQVDYYPNGRPSRFVADVRLGEKEATLEVNHPYSYRWGEDVYLTGYDIKRGGDTDYCILQVVRQPWKYVTVAGILMMLAGAVLLFVNGSKRVEE